MVGDGSIPSPDTAEKPLTKKEKRAKANREAQLKEPIVSPTIFSHPFHFVFFTWFGPILRLVGTGYWHVYLLNCARSGFKQHAL